MGYINYNAEKERCENMKTRRKDIDDDRKAQKENFDNLANEIIKGFDKLDHLK